MPYAHDRVCGSTHQALSILSKLELVYLFSFIKNILSNDDENKELYEDCEHAEVYLPDYYFFYILSLYILQCFD